jgi:hypothetical protein
MTIHLPNLSIKFRYSEKATKTFLNFQVMSTKLGVCFKFLMPSQNIYTLHITFFSFWYEFNSLEWKIVFGYKRFSNNIIKKISRFFQVKRMLTARKFNLMPSPTFNVIITSCIDWEFLQMQLLFEYTFKFRNFQNSFLVIVHSATCLAELT